MGAFYETIPASIYSWILQQKVFYIASAPLSANGHINVSPKGGPYFGLIDPSTFWYIDLTGSGVETLSHLHEPGNGRITVMFNAFSGPPQIVRLWGKGEVLEYGTKDFNEFVEENNVEVIAGTRAIIRVRIHQVGSSCGFSMPFYEFQGFRNTLNEFFEKRVASEEKGNHKDGIERYWAFKNSQSMDGLPGLKRGVETARKEKVKPIKKMVGPKAPILYDLPRVTRTVSMRYLILIAVLSFFIGIAAAFLVALQLGYLKEKGDIPKVNSYRATVEDVFAWNYLRNETGL